MPSVYTISQAKKILHKILREVESGKTVIICHGGAGVRPVKTPIVKIIPYKEEK